VCSVFLDMAINGFRSYTVVAVICGRDGAEMLVDKQGLDV
jgi:hypothetical protein